MNRFLVGTGAVALAVAGVVGGMALIPGSSPKIPAVAAAQAAEPSYGESRTRKDEGEQHFIHGRYPEALAYWEAAAGKGDAYAAFRLGQEYMDGKPGVAERDYKLAMKYDLQAARSGYASSMFDLGTMYEFGFGTTANLTEAARWYGHSATYGLAQGQYNYATMLEAGEGVGKDEVEALKFFILAARGGFAGVPYNGDTGTIDQSAPPPAEALTSRLSKDQVKEARARADAFRAASGPMKGE